jgi:hypothetical protein
MEAADQTTGRAAQHSQKNFSRKGSSGWDGRCEATKRCIAASAAATTTTTTTRCTPFPSHLHRSFHSRRPELHKELVAARLQARASTQNKADGEL